MRVTLPGGCWRGVACIARTVGNACGPQACGAVSTATLTELKVVQVQARTFEDGNLDVRSKYAPQLRVHDMTPSWDYGGVPGEDNMGFVWEPLNW